MKKDKITSIRINSDILEEIKALGLSPQMILDDAIKELFNVEVDETIKITVK